MRYYLTPEPDPAADDKIADINQLYQTAQERIKRGEATVSTDEMTGVQALERKHPDLPMQPGHVLRRDSLLKKSVTVEKQLDGKIRWKRKER